MTGLKCGVIKSSTNLSVNILTLIAKTLMNVDSWWWFFYFVIHWMSSASVWDSEISELEAYFLLLFLKIYHFIWKNKHSYRERRRGRETASQTYWQTDTGREIFHPLLQSLCVPNNQDWDGPVGSQELHPSLPHECEHWAVCHCLLRCILCELDWKLGGWDLNHYPCECCCHRLKLNPLCHIAGS